MVAKKKTAEQGPCGPMSPTWTMIPVKLVMIIVFTFIAYLINLWVVTTGAGIMGLAVTADNAALSASIMTAACIIMGKNGKHHLMHMHGHPGKY